ncbi:FAD-dependent oxidoreductase [Paenibacillus sp. H1-7]|uniref:FAD-dependent oxidoreductase n=1 Tax=Paenibacillus sp. H1-7 TaxID=2282849 RepID=UPI001EF75CB9|nr:FAD-dependent oxidoreductase [Paenibacillus sp. H1-7]ULL19028.1 FAD-dependent oxidoreductase [Paenibacillus sp. H1-7]
MDRKEEYDVVVVGGGFYGCNIALLMKQYFSKVLIIEKSSDLLSRASLVNQARVHNGYHYPRNIITAYRSYVNFPRFIKDFNKCVVDDFEKLYAIVKSTSKVNAYQFYNMFQQIGTPIEVADTRYQKLFNHNLVEEVFKVKEFAFDAVILKEMLKEQLDSAGVEVLYDTEVQKVKQDVKKILVSLSGDRELHASHVYNCTYSQINKMLRNSNLPLLPFKHEITEMALIEMPDELKKIGITVMDGPFFSTMPYPSENLHSFSHVRYTPHRSWNDMNDIVDGEEQLLKSKSKSNFIYMLRDTERYLPIIRESKYIKSIYEIKTVLLQNEADDGRPILFKKDYFVDNLSIVMGGKIDNIYDILELINETKQFSNHGIQSAVSG